MACENTKATRLPSSVTVAEAITRISSAACYLFVPVRRGVFALVLASFALCVAAGVGCDGESSFSIPPADAGAPASRYQAACAAWARGFCAFQEACPAYYILWSDGQCIPRRTLQCEVVASDPNVAFDPAAAAGCAEPEAGACGAIGGSLCVGPGRAPVGTPCLVGDACQTGNCEYTYDVYGVGSACGTCAPPPCGGACPRGEVCGFAGDGGVACLRVASVGEPCSMPFDCETFYCAPTGRCGQLAQLGETCGEGATGPPCASPDTFCDSTKHCRKYLLAGYGQPCASTATDQYVCTGLGTCDENVCIPPSGDGAFCDDAQGLGCLFPARCISHRCMFPSLAACSGP